MREAWRRGGAPLLVVAFAGVFLVAAFAGESATARYAFATDLAAALAFVGALFYGALPLATDRERRRLLIPCASPVTPAGWALGNALGAAAVGALLAMLLFAAAGVGTAVRGGIATYSAQNLGDLEGLSVRFSEHGGGQPVARRLHDGPVLWVAQDQWVEIDGFPRGIESVRFKTRAAPVAGIEGTPTVLTIGMAPGSAPVHTPIGGHVQVPVNDSARAMLQNRTPGLQLGLVVDRSRALGAPVSFLGTALGTGVPVALGAAFLAALATGAAALLSGPVAALLAGVVLILGALRSFLLDAIEHVGAANAEDVGQAMTLREASGGFFRGLLTVIPDLGGLDHSASLSRGEWMASSVGSSTLYGLLLLGVAAVLAALVGGYGIHTRRLQ
ncbi:MAG: hypothetical protein O7C98_14310 [Planctomycetota bacterium]|nr:hypothetical protein [Planctomycetota bacterium]